MLRQLLATMKSAILVFLFRCINLLPDRLRLALGSVCASLMYRLMKRRRFIVGKNLELCFPEASQAQRDRWMREHFRALAQTMIDRAVLWYGSEEKIRRLVHLEGYEHIQQSIDSERPTLLFAPHFVGLDAAATILSMHLPRSATMYTPASDPQVDAVMIKGRGRFNDVTQISRKEGIRPLLRLMRQGAVVYYLPDMDFGREGALFVPFFGVDAATLPATAQIARTWEADVIPIVTRWDRTTGHYYTQVLPPFADFPGQMNLEQATLFCNQQLEAWIRPDPPQYYWVHRRFKTRPEGEKKFY